MGGRPLLREILGQLVTLDTSRLTANNCVEVCSQRHRAAQFITHCCCCCCCCCRCCLDTWLWWSKRLPRFVRPSKCHPRSPRKKTSRTGCLCSRMAVCHSLLQQTYVCARKVLTICKIKIEIIKKYSCQDLNIEIWRSVAHQRTQGWQSSPLMTFLLNFDLRNNGTYLCVWALADQSSLLRYSSGSAIV